MLHGSAKRIILLMAGLLSACDEGGGGQLPEPTTTWIDVAAGLQHSCAVTTENVAYCWGSGAAGQLGTGAPTATVPPTAVAGGLRFRAIGAGDDFTCGVTTGGQVYCWGENGLNQLGDGTTTDRSAPVPVAGLPPVAELFVGARGVYAFTEDERRFCWGADCRGGNEPALQPVPAEVASLPPLRGMASRGPHWCGASRARGVVCWGAGIHRSLGTPPAEFDPLRDYTISMSGTSFRDAAAGAAHSCGLASTGIVYCWGHNGYAQLGLGAREPTTDPAEGRLPVQPIRGDRRFTEVFAGGRISCALDAEGAAFCWGDNAFGQVGAGSSSAAVTSPTEIAGGRKFLRLSIGSMDAEGRQHVCGITLEGKLYCWGSGASGGAGPRVEGMAAAPVPVDDPV